MKHGKILFQLAGVTGLILLAVLATQYRGSAPPLTVHLRCVGLVTGTLAVTVRADEKAAKSTKQRTAHFDLKTACATGKLEIADYTRGQRVAFAYDPGNSHVMTIQADYGNDIQSDQHGPYMVLKITATPPAIVMDQI